MDFEEFMTILGPKLLSSDNREGFLGNTIDNIFWQVRDAAEILIILTLSLPHASMSSSTHLLFPVFHHRPEMFLGSASRGMRTAGNDVCVCFNPCVLGFRYVWSNNTWEQ